ncbi:MAG: hypothetical protein KAR19_06665 [Bacteroidales bacterium]|nr:hypothetical protein [Bacteroidales bacterium]
MKKNSILLLITVFSLLSCTKEPAIEPNAQFSTDLDGSTAIAGEAFNILLNNCTGDFLTLYQGLTPKTTWNPDTATSGTPVDKSLDSVSIKYANPGKYPLTLVASSSGNWGEEFPVDVCTENITVVEP